MKGLTGPFSGSSEIGLVGSSRYQVLSMTIAYERPFLKKRYQTVPIYIQNQGGNK